MEKMLSRNLIVYLSHSPSTQVTSLDVADGVLKHTVSEEGKGNKKNIVVVLEEVVKRTKMLKDNKMQFPKRKLNN